MNYDSQNYDADKTSKAIDGGKIGDQLTSDNSFSEKGLENAELLNKTMKKEK